MLYDFCVIVFINKKDGVSEMNDLAKEIERIKNEIKDLSSKKMFIEAEFMKDELMLLLEDTF